jgi:hypothetical protein
LGLKKRRRSPPFGKIIRFPIAGLSADTLLVIKMLFGGKAKAEEVGQGELHALLNSCFDRKLGQLGARTEGVAADLRRAADQFLAACEKFERIDPEPYTEDLYSFNVNFIRSQKGLYAEALKRLAEELVPEPAQFANAYEECESIASHVGRVSSEILKTNATFRLVVHCYPNYLSDFKKSFSSIERLTGALRAELDRRAGEFSEYRAIHECVSLFESYGRELEETRRAVEGLKEGSARGPSGTPGAGHGDIQERLAAAKAELARVDAEISGLRHRVSLLAAPLDRPSKKFDHLSARKRPLHSFIEDPIGTIRGKEEYGEFVALVRQLVEAVDSDAVDVKNKEEVARIASALIDSDILSLADSSRSMQRARSDLEKEIGSLGRTLTSLNEGKTASESAAHRIAALEEQAAGLARKRAAQKGAVERLFMESYRRRISIRE